MRRFLARFSESEASNHTPSLADFTTTTPELKFSVHTRLVRAANVRNEDAQVRKVLASQGALLDPADMPPPVTVI